METLEPQRKSALLKKKNHYIFKKTTTSTRKMFCGGFILFGTIALTKNVGLGIFFLSIGAIIFFINDGIQIDLTQHKIRVGTRIFWGITGKWTSIANYKYIVVSEVGGTYRNGISALPNYKIFLSSVDIYKYQSIQLGESRGREQAIRDAEKWGANLKLPVKVNK